MARDIQSVPNSEFAVLVVVLYCLYGCFNFNTCHYCYGSGTVPVLLCLTASQEYSSSILYDPRNHVFRNRFYDFQFNFLCAGFRFLPGESLVVSIRGSNNWFGE
ncbi:hypothetical protein FB466_1024 [Klugiella xanthotipulae]|uniref:Uncharacterized protein n=1 Tax=Klugiella xanthotipulae TaxID=244735 RepID=A0A543I6G7_9MICO|nr:hypothetical protein FB466_1024 [Klugiella xanthotipulae]